MATLPLGFATDDCINQRIFNEKNEKFTGDEIYPATGKPDRASYPDWREWLVKVSGDSAAILLETYRRTVRLDMTTRYQERITEVNNEPIDGDNTIDDVLMKSAKYQDAINKTFQQKEKDQRHALVLLHNVATSVSTQINVEVKPIITQYLEDSVRRIYAIMDFLDDKYTPTPTEVNNLMLFRIHQTGRAETKAHLKSMLTAFDFWVLKQDTALHTINPLIVANITGISDNQRSINKVNRDLQKYKDTCIALRAQADINKDTNALVYPPPPQLHYPYPVQSALARLAVFNYQSQEYCKKVSLRKASGPLPQFNMEDSADLSPPLADPKILRDHRVRPMTNLATLQAVRERLESNPHSEIFMYRELVLAAEENDRPYKELSTTIIKKLAKDTPSLNHLQSAIHAAHAAVHGHAHGSASSHSAIASDVINDLLDHGTGSANMAIGSGSQLDSLATRVRFLEQAHGGEIKRSRSSYPCVFWGVDPATGRRSCSREEATGTCPYDHHHYKDITVPAEKKWTTAISAQEILAINPGPYGPPPPIQSPLGAPGLGQSLRPSL